MERFTYNLSNQLASEYDINIILYVWDKRTNLEWGEWHENITIRRVPYVKYYQKFIAKLFYTFWVKKDKPSHVIINFLYHGESSLPKNLNLFYVLHSPSSLIPVRYQYIAQKLTLFSSITGISVSEFVKKEAEPYFNNIKLETIYHGIDTKLFKKQTMYKHKETLKIITLSALEEWKGIQDVIKAISGDDMRGYFKYDIYGAGPYKNQLSDLIKMYGLENRATLKGTINNVEDIFPMYDIYCQMSEGDAFGLSLFEAMACGLPSIVYDIPPFNTLFSENIVKKVRNKSVRKLRTALLSFMDRDVRAKFGRNGNQYVTDNFSIGNMGKHYMKLLTRKR